MGFTPIMNLLYACHAVKGVSLALSNPRISVLSAGHRIISCTKTNVLGSVLMGIMALTNNSFARPAMKAVKPVMVIVKNSVPLVFKTYPIFCITTLV